MLSITFSFRPTRMAARRSDLMRVGMLRAYTRRRRQRSNVLCNGCRPAIGDRNTIRTTVVFRSVSDRVVLSPPSPDAAWGRRREREGEISPRINGVYSIMIPARVHTCTYVRTYVRTCSHGECRTRASARDAQHYREADRRWRREDVCVNLTRANLSLDRADVYKRFREFRGLFFDIFRRGRSTIVKSVLLHL